MCHRLVTTPVCGKQKYITCRSIGRFFMLSVTTLPPTLILYLEGVDGRIILKWIFRKWNGRHGLDLSDLGGTGGGLL
jgi:hypothetical protein